MSPRFIRHRHSRSCDCAAAHSNTPVNSAVVAEPTIVCASVKSSTFDHCIAAVDIPVFRLRNWSQTLGFGTQLSLTRLCRLPIYDVKQRAFRSSVQGVGGCFRGLAGRSVQAVGAQRFAYICRFSLSGIPEWAKARC